MVRSICVPLRETRHSGSWSHCAIIARKAFKHMSGCSCCCSSTLLHPTRTAGVSCSCELCRKAARPSCAGAMLIFSVKLSIWLCPPNAPLMPPLRGAKQRLRPVSLISAAGHLTAVTAAELRAQQGSASASPPHRLSCITSCALHLLALPQPQQVRESGEGSGL